MSDIAIKVENVSKKYELGLIGSGTLRETISNGARNIFGKKTPQNTSKEFWALKDINFEVNQGEVIGIVGKNGAGKSTLLKVLSRITEPTSGRITIEGRIASLLEVGTGFHPELSGRENIFLNGSILGMTRKEIKLKFDEIVDFSGVEKFLDTPVKRYSSGMYVRLAFAVAAHLEPEILVIDEVLSVGDAEFQQKCLGKMNDVAQGGRTVLFVSHNMAAVKQLCSKGILLEEGKVKLIDEIDPILDQYLTNNELANNNIREELLEGQKAIVQNIELINKRGEVVNSILSGDNLSLKFTILSSLDFSDSVTLEMGIDSNMGERLTFLSNAIIDKKIMLKKGKNEFSLTIDKFPFLSGTYYITFRLKSFKEILDWQKQFTSFQVTAGDFYNTGRLNAKSRGKFLLNYDIKKK